MHTIETALVIGATGSVGRYVVAQLMDRGISVRAITRNLHATFPDDVDVVVGDIADPATVADALENIDAVVFTHGANGTAEQHRSVDYGAVYNVITQASRSLRIALMTAIYVTHHELAFNRPSEVFDWKRRSERLVRASGLPYTIVRPAWFDFNAPDQHRLAFLQGDQHASATPADGVIAREQIARVLVESLFTVDAMNKTLELQAEKGAAQQDLAPLFADLSADEAESVDGAADQDTLPLNSEPAEVLEQLDHVSEQRP